jgi:hypothetical protein
MQIEIVYERARQEFLARRLLRFHEEALRAKRELGTGRGLQEMLYISGSLANVFNVLLYHFKDSSWAKEKELRYVFQTLTEAPPAGTVLKFRPSGNVQKPYVEIDFSAVPLRVLIAGPGVSDAKFWSVRSALERNGYGATPMYRSSTALP